MDREPNARFQGALYSGGLATPLRDIVRIDSWLADSAHMQRIKTAAPMRSASSGCRAYSPTHNASRSQRRGALTGSRVSVNFADSSGVTFTIADDSANDRVNVTAIATRRGRVTARAYTRRRRVQFQWDNLIDNTIPQSTAASRTSVLDNDHPKARLQNC